MDQLLLQKLLWNESQKRQWQQQSSSKLFPVAVKETEAFYHNQFLIYD